MIILPMWVCSVLASAGIEVSTAFKIYKEAADQGYKININKLKNQNTEQQKYNNGNSFASLVVPGVNISRAVKLRDEYHERKNARMTELAILGALEKMTELEKTEYSANPTALNAILISAKSVSLEESTPEFNFEMENFSLEDVMRNLQLDEEQFNMMFPGFADELKKKSTESQTRGSKVNESVEKTKAKIKEAEESLKRYAKEHGINEKYESSKKELSSLVAQLMDKTARMMENASQKMDEASKHFDQQGTKLTNKPKNNDKK